MADKIRANIEAALPALRHFERKGLLSRAEIGALLAEREQLEYALAKFGASPMEFLRAIEFELSLERRRRARAAEKGQKIARGADFHFLRRGYELVGRALKRHGRNADVALAALSFAAQSESPRHFRRLLAAALRRNPTEARLWIAGALYEFEAQRNPFQARQVYFRALAANARNADIWLSFFRFEVRFAALLAEREAPPIESEGEMAFEASEQEGEANIVCPIKGGDSEHGEYLENVLKTLLSEFVADRFHVEHLRETIALVESEQLRTSLLAQLPESPIENAAFDPFERLACDGEALDAARVEQFAEAIDWERRFARRPTFPFSKWERIAERLFDAPKAFALPSLCALLDANPKSALLLPLSLRRVWLGAGPKAAVEWLSKTLPRTDRRVEALSPATDALFAAALAMSECSDIFELCKAQRATREALARALFEGGAEQFAERFLPAFLALKNICPKSAIAFALRRGEATLGKHRLSIRNVCRADAELLQFYIASLFRAGKTSEAESELFIAKRSFDSEQSNRVENCYRILLNGV